MKYIFEQLPTETLEGSSQGLILFTVAALSSLDEGVRIDGLKVLDLLLERIPAEIVRGWDGGTEVEEERKGSLEDKGVGGKVVEALLGVLRVRSAALAVGQGSFTSAASADLSPSVSDPPRRSCSGTDEMMTVSTGDPDDAGFVPQDEHVTHRLYLDRSSPLVPLQLLLHHPILQLFRPLLHLIAPCHSIDDLAGHRWEP